MENMLKYDFMKYRHRLLYYRVVPIYIRYTSYSRCFATPADLYWECESHQRSFVLVFFFAT